jgi:hypothetical protein
MPINLPLPSNVSTLSNVGMFDSTSGTSGSNSINNTSPNIESNIVLEGKIIDNTTKEPLAGVNVTLTQTPGVNTKFNGVIEPITDNVKTNANGEWSLIYPRTKIDLRSVNILFFKQDYKPITISNPQISTKYPSSDTPFEVEKTSKPSSEPPYEYKVGNEKFKSSDQNVAQTKANDYASKLNSPKYKGASVVYIKRSLYKSPKPEEAIKSLAQPIIDEVNKLESDQDYNKAKGELPPATKIANNVNINKETLKRKLIPFVLRLLLPFGISAVQAILNKTPINDVKNQILCPRQDKILELINKRNKLVKQINGIYKTITTLSKILLGANVVITVLEVGILAVTVIPLPAPPVVPVAASKLEEPLRKAKVVVNILTLSLAAFGAFLGIVLRLLNALDALIQECAQSQDIPFETINNELNTLVNTSTGLSNSNVIQLTQDSQQLNSVYRGFILEIKFDDTNSNKYPKRFAQALTRTGIPVLKTDSSFASDPQVLLDQLKFIIDSNPQLTAE